MGTVWISREDVMGVGSEKDVGIYGSIVPEL